MSHDDDHETVAEDGDGAAQALAAWRERRDRGEDVSIDDLCREKPALADAIRARAAALEALGRHLRGDRERDAISRLPSLRSDRYSSFRATGEGGMGIVYWAIDSDLNREVAFKIVRPQAGGDKSPAPTEPTKIAPPAHGTPASSAFETLKARFLQEAWVTAGMSHPGIVPVYELGQTPEGVPYYTMRFVRGNRTLAQAIDELKGKAWDARSALVEPFLKVCDTISYAHAQGVVHRDIKPDNIALGEFGEVVVLDWGLAKIQDRPDAAGDLWRERIEEFRESSDLKTLASALGTPGFMSPEAALGRVQEVDARSDVYSLGAVLHRILTGRPVFEFASYGELIKKLMEGTPAAPRDADPTVPEALSNLVVRALSKNRDARPASAREMAQEIRDWQTRSAVDREAESLLRDARAGLAAAERLHGADAADALDRAATSAQQIERLRPGDAAARALQAEIGRRREVAVAERERLARGRTARRAAVAGLAVAAAAAATFAVVVDSERRETALARDEAAQQRDAKAAALAGEKTERERADAERRHARALGLAHAAAERLAADPQLSLLLARESVRVDASSEGVSRLHDALARCREKLRLERGAAGIADAARVGGGDRFFVANDDGSLRLCGPDGRTVKDVAPRHAPLGAMDVSPAGDLVACGFLDRTAGIWSASGEPVSDLPGHTGVVDRVEWSRDGRRLLTVDERADSQPNPEARVRVWDAKGRLLATLGDAEHAPCTARIAPAGDAALIGSVDGTVALWKLDGTRTWTVAADGGDAEEARPVSDAAFLPDGGATWVHTGGRLRVAAPDGKLRADVVAHGDECIAVRPSPDGATIATRDMRGDLAFWDASGALVRRADRAQTAAVVASVQQAAAWTPDGSRFYSAAADGAVHAFTARGEVAGTIRGHRGFVRAIRFSKDGEILTVGGDREAVVWDAGRAEDLAPDVGGDRRTSLAWSPDGRLLATSGASGLRVWRADGTLASQHAGSAVRGLRFSPDGRFLVGSLPASARLVEVATGNVVELSPSGKRAAEPSFSPDGSLVVVPDSDGAARLFGTDGVLRATLTGHTAPVAAARFAPDGRSVVTCAEDSSVRRWSVTGELLATSAANGRRPASLDIAPDGTVATGFMEAEFVLWSAGSAKAAEPRLVGGWVVMTEFLPDGRLLLCNFTDAAVIAPRDGGPLVHLRGGPARVVAVAASADGSIVATGSEDGSIRLWTPDGDELASFAGHTNAVIDAAFSPDGSRLATSSADGTVRTWLVSRDALLRRADERATRGFSGAELQRYAGLLGEDDRVRLRGGLAAERALAEALLRDDAAKALAASADLGVREKAAALDVLGGMREVASSQNEAAWRIVLPATATAAERDRAVRLARAAVGQRGDVADFVNTYALALHRAGKSAEAEAALRSAMRLRRADDPSSDDDLVLALVLAARGDRDGARVAFDRAKAARESLPPGARSGAQPLADEAEAALGGKR